LRRGLNGFHDRIYENDVESTFSEMQSIGWYDF